MWFFFCLLKRAATVKLLVSHSHQDKAQSVDENSRQQAKGQEGFDIHKAPIPMCKYR